MAGTTGHGPRGDRLRAGLHRTPPGRCGTAAPGPSQASRIPA